MCSLLIIHSIGLSNNFYWVYPWFDIPVHFIGGFAIGLLTAIFVKTKLKWVLFAVILTFLFGWEMFELFIVEIPIYSSETYLTDTVLDLAFGLFGGVFGLYIFNK